jgi:DNA polymerase-3 subunit delta
MAHEQILQELQAGKVRPLYLLHGPETYFIDQIVEYAEHHLLDESERAFNLTVCYGRDTDPGTLLDAARRYPMLSKFQVIILKEAQDMKHLADLQSYIERPTESTVLFICHMHKLVKMNTKFGAALKANAVIMESKLLYEDKLPFWINNYLKSKNYKITSGATELMAEFLGTQLSKIVNELDKMALQLPPGSTINENHVETYIGISKDYNPFELQKALGKKDFKKITRIVQYVEANPKVMSLVQVIAVLYGYFSKLWLCHHYPDKMANKNSDKDLAGILKVNEFALKDYREALKNYSFQKVEEIMALLHEYDLKIKGVNYDTKTDSSAKLLKELCWRILN